MKRLLLSSVMAGSAFSASADLLVTGVIDGPLSGGTPKAIEIYVTKDIADLSKYGVGAANNGGGSDGQEFTFPAVSVSAGQFIYLASESNNFSNFFGFMPDYTSGAMSINGDDAIELFKEGAVVDLFGDIDVDGTGQPWEYLDGWAYRVNGSEARPAFDLAQWQFSSRNALDNESDNISAAKPFPLASYDPEGGSVLPPAQVLINEVDSDTEGSDRLEFIELYDGGLGNTDLSGLSLVLFNGSDNLSYQAYDLDGYVTNEEGYFVLGNSEVAGVDFVISNNSIQNGADAIALVRGDTRDFPNDSALPSKNIVDAIVYDTNDADNATLLALLQTGQPQVNEASTGSSMTVSNQRCDNGEGGARNTQSYLQAMPTPGQANQCSVPVLTRLISEIQGTPSTQTSNSRGETDVSPLDGQPVQIEAVVIGDFQDGDADESRNLRGFFVQEEASDEDGDRLSSEGIFVFDGGEGLDVNVGDLVRVSGTVTQNFGETQLSNISSLEVLASNKLNLVNVADISLLGASDVTLGGDGKFQPDLEAYEGMLVRFPETLQIAEQFQLDRFNEIKLVAGERPRQFTQDNQPNAAQYAQAQQALGARRITYDDGLNEQTASINNLDGFAPYNEASAKRMGDTVTGLTGVLDYKWAGNRASGSTWRVRAHLNGVNTFTSSADENSPNPRPASPTALEGSLKVASLNVLNFFTTLDDRANQTAVGQSPRGADDLTRFGINPATAELDRQLAKTLNAIIAMDADVLGLVEIENEFDPINDGSTAIEVLVNALNAKLGGKVYDYVYPGQQFVGTDAIAVAMIYKPAVVELAEGTTAALLDDTVAASLDVFAGRDFNADPIFNGRSTNRVSLAASFKHLESEELVTMVVNHFKSKGPSGLSDQSSPNFDQANGAGFWNQRRLDASVAVKAWLDSHPTGLASEHSIIMGDLNAYAQEEPVQYLLANSYNNVESDDAYSFVFDGQVGTLDYILVSDSLLEVLNGASVWHMNADEADALDYNLDFGRDASYFDATSATRNSDHDPLVIALNLESEQVPVTLDAVIKFYKQGLDNASVMGVGNSWYKRFVNSYRFYRILDKANNFAQNGRSDKACKQLVKADKQSDGLAKPKDRLMGEGVSALNSLIASAHQSLACTQ